MFSAYKLKSNSEGAFGFLSMTLLYILAFFKLRNPYATGSISFDFAVLMEVGIHVFNFFLYLVGYVLQSFPKTDVRFALIAANLYSTSFCNLLPSGAKTTFCEIPKAVLAIDIITWSSTLPPLWLILQGPFWRDNSWRDFLFDESSKE